MFSGKIADRVSSSCVTVQYFAVEQISIRKNQLIPICFAETLAFSDLLMSHRQGSRGNQPDFFPVDLAGILHCPGFLNLARTGLVLGAIGTGFLIAEGNLEIRGTLNGSDE